MIITFGKHEGKEIEDLPSSYLQWLAENCDNEMVCEAADKEYRYREDHGSHHE